MKKKILAVFLAIALAISVLSVGVFAADDETDAAITVPSEDATNDVIETPEVTLSDEEEEEDSSATSTTDSGSAGTTTDSNWFENHKSLVIAVIVVLAIALIVFIIYLVSPKFKEKFKKFWKDFNAEFKKLVWPTKKQLIRNSAVVLITIVVAGAILALLDLGFSRGMFALKDLVKLIKPVD